MAVVEADRLLVARIRRGEPTAWQECIARFEGRLLAFVKARLQNHSTSEDVVQDTFIGFLTALPNYDDQTPLESFLFSIAAHKLTDVLRRQGRRPTVPLAGESDEGGARNDVPARTRPASSFARSRERRSQERSVLEEGLKLLIRQWAERREFERLKCIELLFVLGWPNKTVAERLGISEQAVANHKFYAVNKLREWWQKSPHVKVELDALLK